MEISEGDTITMEYTGLLEDGSVFDTSRESVAQEADLEPPGHGRDYGPITVEVGAGRLIEGVEDALLGLEPGEEVTIEVPPEKGYGERTDEQIVEEDREELAEMLGETPTAGTMVETQQGSFGEIVEVGDEDVTIDFNHQLAGEHLAFEIEVLEVR